MRYLCDSSFASGCAMSMCHVSIPTIAACILREVCLLSVATSFYKGGTHRVIDVHSAVSGTLQEWGCASGGGDVTVFLRQSFVGH